MEREEGIRDLETLKGQRKWQGHRSETKDTREKSQQYSSSKGKSLGLIGMQKGSSDLSRYSGKLKEDLDGVIEYFETLSEMCDLSTDQMKKAIPLMLKGNDLRLYAKNKHRVGTYDEGIKLLWGCYNYKEKQTRLINQWKRVRLTESFVNNLDMSAICRTQSIDYGGCVIGR